VKIALDCSVFFHSALVEFAFGVVERGMTGSEPGLDNIYYNM
jgi:hypothetical protein